MTKGVAKRPAFHDQRPTADRFQDDVVAGLSRPQKQLPAKYFYDERGSQLFEQISQTEDYYLTRADLEVTRSNAARMAELAGPNCMLVEYGSGSSLKTRLLLDQLTSPAGYVPIDISAEHLRGSATALADAYPDLEVLPLCADYTSDFDLPKPSRSAARRIVYFPGSTIGNLEPGAAQALLRRIAALAGSGGGLIVGVDLKKDPLTLNRAYKDAAGLTAAFNLNLLRRINRELGADFDLAQFRHHAFLQSGRRRVEMHLVSLSDQSARIDGFVAHFEVGESIWTESSYKYTEAGFIALAESAGFRSDAAWTESERLFSIHYLSVA